MADRICGTCENLNAPPDKYTAPARCRLDDSLDIHSPYFQHPLCPLRPECPPLGLTLQAPWTALVGWGGKDVENRSAMVASRLRSYRGRVALTASAQFTIPGNGEGARERRLNFWQKVGESKRLHPDVLREMTRVMMCHQHLAHPDVRLLTMSAIANLGGQWFATARVEGILPPAQNNGPWSRDGQWGIVLRDVQVLDKFEPATGAQGVFSFGRCKGCGRPVAGGSRHKCKS